MSYKKGDIILIKFPFTNLQQSKKRPVLIIKDENELGDFLCLQITSKDTQKMLIKVTTQDLKESNLKLLSFVKYDKCFTLNSGVVDKKLASVNDNFMDKLKTFFCEELF